MCGITGFLLNSPIQAERMQNIARKMADKIIHRGPDDGGEWVDASAGIALSHRRLSILDLSPEGHQPMASVSGRYVLVYNGEVYNFAELRKELVEQGSDFRGHSDTEVILAAIEAWGLEASVKRFVGMFAFALWDKKEHCLHLVRDRLGIKPLYYGWVNGIFVFGSELKALKVFPDFKQAINRNAMALMMRYGYIPTPYSIYEDIYKLAPGHCLSLNAKNIREPITTRYWSAKEVAEAGIAKPFTGSDTEAIDQLDTLLREAVGIRMVADVPLGAFLSGGYDSTMVAAQMQAQSSQPVKTFSIGFHEEGYNEAQHAKVIAKHLKTDHTELYVSPEDAMAVIPSLATLYDEPFADSSQIPTYLVSKLAREHVTVSLSGDGGDELFGGYNRYFLGEQIWAKVGPMPKMVRTYMAKGINSLSQNSWNSLFDNLGFLLPAKYRFRLPGDKLYKLAEVTAAESTEAFYKSLVSHWKTPTDLVLNSHEPLTALTDSDRQAAISNFTQYMMYTDLVSYMPDDILTKVDRASMGVSLEARVPLIDHRLVEFAWRLPQHMKVRNGEGKWILRQVLDRYVPRKIMERPKMGFGIPIDDWLRGPLRDWAENLLDEQRLKDEGFFNAGLVRQKWLEHLSGKRQWHYHLWDVLMFQAWLEEWE
ncbi:MAG TPA: asparagine synthase (glutamine-hydrolyzing) [Pseudomonadales bacterium]